MKNATIGKPSAAELEKIKALRDEDIVLDDDEPYDPNDPDSVAAFWKDAVVTKGGGVEATTRELREALAVRRRPGQRGPQKTPTKVQVTLRLSPEVLAYFKAQGAGWQTRLNEALKAWVETHRSR